MTDTTTQSGQRPPATNRPTDAELARLLREFAELRDDMSDGLPSAWDEYTERVRWIAAALDAADALAPECGCFYCDRPTISDNDVFCADCRAEREASDDY